MPRYLAHSSSVNIVDAADVAIVVVAAAVPPTAVVVLAFLLRLEKPFLSPLFPWMRSPRSWCFCEILCTALSRWLHQVARKNPSASRPGWGQVAQTLL